MNKSKFLTLLIVGLLISNGILLFMFMNGPKKHKEPKFIIIDNLHFDKEQILKYELCIQKHRNAINDNEAKMNNLRKDLYKQLKFQYDTISVDSLVSKIASQQYLSEQLTYNHFLEIKNICKPSQLNDFDELTNRISNLFSE